MHGITHLKFSRSNFSSLLTSLAKKRTIRMGHVADLGSLDPEGMKLFVRLPCGMEDNMEHMETVYTAVDCSRVAGLVSCKHSNDFTSSINSPALWLSTYDR
jgi:hypothetical protein